MATAVRRAEQRHRLEVARGLPRAALAAFSVLAACEQGQQPRQVDLAAIAGDKLASAVLDECHAPLRGRMVGLAARVTIGAAETQAWVALPDKLRANDAEGALLLIGAAGHRLRDGKAEDLPADATARLAALRTLIDAASFGPLHRAASCARVDGCTFRVTTGEGSTWTVVLRENSLLPRRFTGPGGTVEITDYLRTRTTWVCRRATMTGLGECAVRFEEPDIRFTDAFFDLPGTPQPAEEPKKPLRRPPGAAPEERPAEPALQDLRAHRLVTFADPGDWPARTREYTARFRELQRQNQQIAGFVTFFGEGAAARMAVPFREREGGPPFVVPDGWQIVEVPKGRQLVVFPPDGSVADRAARGCEQIEVSLHVKGLTAAAPWRWQPYFDLHKAEPTAAELAAPIVRVSVPVRD